MMRDKTITHGGEAALLALIEKGLKGVPESLSRTPIRVPVGFGDDAALLAVEQGFQVLVTTDLLIEDVHFRKRYVSPEQLGYKALAVNMSDIAAMGGIPSRALIGLALPPSTPFSFVEGLYNGMIRTGREYGVGIIGGDTVRSPGPVVIAVTMIGAVQEANAITRSGASPGDRIMVTGELGGAMLGLELLEKGDGKGNIADGPCTRFLHPIPRVREAGIMARDHLATAMIDLSDGLTQDLAHLCQASCTGARIEAGSVPIDSAVARLVSGKGADPLRYALSGGEDYEILFTVRPENAQFAIDRVRAETGTRVSDIGVICPEDEGIALIDDEGRESPLPPGGFEHFSSKKADL
ncbi:MAG: thiamine-phosphate kinase [bacterium]